MMNAVLNEAANLRFWEIAVFSSFTLVIISILIQIARPESSLSIFKQPKADEWSEDVGNLLKQLQEAK